MFNVRCSASIPLDRFLCDQEFILFRDLLLLCSQSRCADGGNLMERQIDAEHVRSGR